MNKALINSTRHTYPALRIMTIRFYTNEIFTQQLIAHCQHTYSCVHTYDHTYILRTQTDILQQAHIYHVLENTKAQGNRLSYCGINVTILSHRIYILYNLDTTTNTHPSAMYSPPDNTRLKVC